MNIKSINGRIVHIQKNQHRTVCGRSLTIRLYDRQSNRFNSTPYFIETEEEVTCIKCKNIQ